MTRLSINPASGDRPRRDEIRLREVDRSGRRTADALAEVTLSARHAWSGARTIPSGATDVLLTNPADWSVLRDAGIAQLWPEDGYTTGGVYLNRSGRWTLTLVTESDAGFAGTMITRFRHGDATAGMFDGRSNLVDSRPRGTGYGGAGFVGQTITWSGYVTPAEAVIPLQLQVRHASAVTTAIVVNYWLQASYLGAGTEAPLPIPPEAHVPQDDPPGTGSG